MSTGPHHTATEQGAGLSGGAVPSAQAVDVLAGWDPAGPPPPLDGAGPFPTDTVAVIAGLVIGAGLGLAVGGRHPLVRANLGGIAGMAVAIAARRRWRLPG
jgi:hypothetical protein